MSLTASTSACTEVTRGSKSTVASCIIRLTAARVTPGAFDKARCTFAWHAAQVMPSTGKVIFSDAGADAVAGAIADL